MKLTNFFQEIKKNDLSSNIVLILLLLYPVFLVVGPAAVEISIFLTIILSFLIFKIDDFKKSIYKLKLIYLLIFFIVSILSSLFSDNILISLKSSFFSLRFFLFSLIILMVMQKIRNFDKLFFSFTLLSCLFFLLDGYFNLILNINIFFENVEAKKPITGLFFDEKKLGRYLISISPIIVGLYFKIINEPINLKIIKIYIFLNITFIIVLFTAERVAMFYCFFTILTFITYSLKINKKNILLLIIPILIFFIIHNLNFRQFSSQVNNTFKQITDGGESFSYPSKQHQAFILTSIELFKKNPVLGIGSNNYRHECKNINYEDVNNCSTHPHNILFQILVENGFFGFLIYLYFLKLIISKVLSFLANIKNRDTNIFFLLPVIYFLNPFFPSGNFYNNWFMAIGTFSIPFYLFFNDNKIYSTK